MLMRYKQMSADLSGVDWPLVLGSFSAVVLFICSVALVVVVAHRKGILHMNLCFLTWYIHAAVIVFHCETYYFLYFFSFHNPLKLKQRPRKRRKGIVFSVLIKSLFVYPE